MIIYILVNFLQTFLSLYIIIGFDLILFVLSYVYIFFGALIEQAMYSNERYFSIGLEANTTVYMKDGYFRPDDDITELQRNTQSNELELVHLCFSLCSPTGR